MSIGYLPPTTNESQLKRAFAFPFQAGKTGFPQMAGAGGTLMARIRALVLTGQGERVMRRGFGVNVHDYVFMTMTSIERARLAMAVTRAIETYEPTVRVLAVTTSRESQGANLADAVVLDIEFEEGGRQQSLSVPLPIQGGA